MHKYGICLFTYIPLRKDPSEQAEMVSQILFGETYCIIDQTKKWCQVQCSYDNYIGWFDIKLLHKIDEVQWKEVNQKQQIVSKSLDHINNNSNNSLQPLVAGSNVPEFLIGGSTPKYNYTFNDDNLDIIAISSQFINAPYLWGGKTMLGIDCSGLTQVAYKILGVPLPRDASQQVKLGTTINFINEVEAGDLAFFDNEEGNITHVGIILSPNKILHASGKVRIDNIDHQGIYNTETQKYSHKLRVIKRIL